MHLRPGISINHTGSALAHRRPCTNTMHCNRRTNPIAQRARTAGKADSESTHASPIPSSRPRRLHLLSLRTIHDPHCEALFKETAYLCDVSTSSWPPHILDRPTNHRFALNTPSSFLVRVPLFAIRLWLPQHGRLARDWATASRYEGALLHFCTFGHEKHDEMMRILWLCIFDGRLAPGFARSVWAGHWLRPCMCFCF